MREYLFHGKRLDNGEWAEGRLLAEDVIIPLSEEFEIDGGRIYGCDLRAYMVDPSTVGQYTGKVDKDGRQIFDGDILIGDIYPYTSEGEINYYAEVIWLDDNSAYGILTVKNPSSKVFGISDGNIDLIECWDSTLWKVVGNIHDDSELLLTDKEG